MNAASSDAAESADPERRWPARRESTGQSRREGDPHVVCSPNDHSSTSGRARTCEQRRDDGGDRLEQRPGDEVRQGGERELQAEAREEGRFQRCGPRDMPGVRQALEMLLEGEAEQRDERDQPDGDRLATRAAHAIERREAEAEHDADEAEHGAGRQLIEVAMTCLCEQGIDMVTRDREVGELMRGQGAEDHERQGHEPRGTPPRAVRQSALSIPCLHQGIRPDSPTPAYFVSIATN